MDGKLRGDDNFVGQRRCQPNPAARRQLIAIITVAALALNWFALSTASAQVESRAWISSWTASPQAPRGVIPASFANRTIRQIAHLSLGGDRIRIRLSNEFGTRPVLIGAATIALAGSGSDIVPASLRAVTFGGSKSIIIPPGAPAA